MPTCSMQGCCCRGASPSTPYHKLLEKAANGDTFAQNFFSIFVPHASHEEARQIVPGLVERTLKAAKKDEAFTSEEDVVFYQCRYIGEDNKCQIWEDRPALCRAYPDTPFVVFAPNCAFEPWSKKVKKAFYAMEDEIEKLKDVQEELKTIQHGEKEFHDSEMLSEWAGENIDNLSLVLTLTPTYLSSPVGCYL